MKAATASSRSEGQKNIVPLLDQLRKVNFDDQGREHVRKAVTTLLATGAADESQLLQLTQLAQQHGLIEESLDILHHLHQHFPRSEKAWNLHIETLVLLDRREEMLKIASRARSHGFQDLPALRDILPDQTEGASDVMDPFVDLRREEEELAVFLRIFQGREDAFARQWVDREKRKAGYVPVLRPLQPSDIRDHLQGRYTYGIYLLDSESRVRIGVIDVDLIQSLRSVPERKKNQSAIRREALYLHTRMTQLAKERNICCLAEFSGNKGYHFWFPVSGPVPAAVMRKVLDGLKRQIADDLKCFHLEVFPKQDRRTGKGFGNLVKLPLGVHRLTGKPSWFLMARDQQPEHQLEWLRRIKSTDPARYRELAAEADHGRIVPHPRLEQWASEFPELAVLEQRCAPLAQIMATLRNRKTLSAREEKILLSTLGHLPTARAVLHHLFSLLPEYNRPLVDYKISRVRGTVLGCKRIHSLLDMGRDLPCRFKGQGYPHPLRHLKLDTTSEPKAERVENLRDALENLKTALRIVERFL